MPLDGGGKPRQLNAGNQHDDDLVYEVRKIVNEAQNEDNTLWYLVEWMGGERTWEPVSNLDGCPEILRAWKRHNNGLSESASDSEPRSRKRSHDSPEEPGKKKARSTRSPSPTRQRKAFLAKLKKIPGPPVTLINKIDDVPSPPTSFTFIKRYKLGEGVRNWAGDHPEMVAGCNCKGDRCGDSCLCVRNHDDVDGSPTRRAYDTNGRLRVVSNPKLLIAECNDKCGCGPACPNKVVQCGRQIPLEIFKTKLTGWGLRCPEPIKKGTLIDTYPGELITMKEANRRSERHSRTGLSYLFDLDRFIDLDQYENGQAPIYVIDGERYGGVARFINHSCDPNLRVFPVTRERVSEMIYDLALFAVKDIPAYTELTFCYRDVKRGEDEADAAECLCGTKKCKGRLW